MNKKQKLDVDRIDCVMKEQGRARKWLASRLDVHEVTVSGWFTKGKIPSKYAEAIAAALGVEIQDLMI